ncbi:hypothetical protein V2J09_010617 [Rumex salicifolius]
MSKKGATALQKDAPWRASSPGAKPIPKIHLSPVLRTPQTPYSSFAVSVMKNPDPVGNGLGVDAVLESAGPDCIVPGQATPIKLLGLKVWPIDLELKFLHRVGRELKMVGRVMDSAVNTMNKTFVDD